MRAWPIRGQGWYHSLGGSWSTPISDHEPVNTFHIHDKLMRLTTDCWPLPTPRPAWSRVRFNFLNSFAALIEHVSIDFPILIRKLSIDCDTNDSSQVINVSIRNWSGNQPLINLHFVLMIWCVFNDSITSGLNYPNLISSDEGEKRGWGKRRDFTMRSSHSAFRSLVVVWMKESQ